MYFHVFSELLGQLRSLGFSAELVLCRTFQGTPMRHRGAHVGNFFVGDKEGGGGFTDGDEDLPVLFASQAAGAIANARAHGKEHEPASVLVVDDDPGTLRHVREALTGTGHLPIVTGEVEEAARLVRTIKPHLLHLDLMLPGRDGVEFMRKTPELSDLPVIFISGYWREETVVRALEAGAADYVVKPFSAAELTARVGAALRCCAGSGQGARTPPCRRCATS